jgi:serine/threonine-protein kinase
MQIVLEVIQGPHCGKRFAFEGHDNFIVGRARCAHFRLPKKDPYFSRVHFMVEVNPPRCRVVDVGSTNGTRVNDQQVESADLSDGDLIQGGDTVLKVSLVEDAVVQADPQLEDTTVPTRRDPPLSRSLEPTEAFDPTSPAEPLAPSNRAGIESSPLPPEIPGFAVSEELGRGGMGTVFRARRDADRSEVAIKMIRPAVAGSQREIERFLREASILQRLRHPHIVAFHEMGRAGELLYFVMDYVPGTDAGKLLRREGPFSMGRAVRLICQVLEALHYAHGQGFVHRDVKPANLLVTGEPGFEICKLADFGLARVYHASSLSGLTILGGVGGTLPYMAPEQITNYRQPLPASDQYSTAATLYRLLTGCYLFDFKDAPSQERLPKILLEEPVSIQARQADIPRGLVDAIHRALEKDPSLRFANVVTFRDALLPFGLAS